MIGKVIKNNYKIMDEIGQGSVATVYLAKDTARNQVVALKIIHPEQAAEGQFLQRFQREVRLLQMLTSPQAVKVFDYGEDEGLNFIVLEHVQGKTLARILEEGPLEVNRALDIAKQVALCLVDAHAKSIVHRDIRPANIMVTADEVVKVMDFGIAWGAELSRLTVTGVLGSPHYLSPEQAQGKEVDARSDLYSLGVTLFEMLTGEKPYDAEGTMDIVLKHVSAPVPSLRQFKEEIPLQVDELVGKCLAKKPEDRYQSAAEFLEAIHGTLRTIARREESVGIGMEANLAGQTLGAYRIIEQIGRGGMATVYKAYEPALDRYVAIKILPQYFAHDPDFATRFEREAKAVAKLNHPNILPIYSSGQEAGLTYIAMRFVEAGTLKEMLGQPLPLKTTADILGQIGRALDYAHQQGVVHRDVKPANVLMAEGKWALLTDFGLARMVESSVQLTKTGVGVGTPAYMSPEQGQGIKVDARTDIYSLGVVLYEMVTGKVPYEAETPMAVVLKHITAPLPLPREVNPDLPEAVERVILKAMAKAPEDRYQTAGEMVEALEGAVAGVPMVERPPKPVPVEKVPPVTVAEPTPAPAAAVPVEAPPVAKKGLPGWVWGVVGAVGAAVLLIVAVGVFLATRGEKPSPTPVTTVGEGGEFWDFESGDAQGWSLDTGWQVVEVEEGYALEGRGPETDKSSHRPAYPPAQSAHVGNFQLSFRLKLVAGGVDVFVRDHSGPSACQLYSLQLYANGLEMSKVEGECGSPGKLLGQEFAPLAYNTWHLVEITAVGSQIDVAIDSQSVLSVEDDAYLAGGLGFVAGWPGAVFYIDDVSLSALAAEEAIAPDFVTEGTLGAVLFKDSFDGTLSSRWQFFPQTWEREQIDGRTVLHNIPVTERFSGAELRNTSWQDYAIQFDFHFWDPGSTGVHFLYVRTRLTNCPPTVEALQAYVLTVTPDRMLLEKERCVEHVRRTLAESDRDLAVDEWHTLQMVLIGNRIQVLVDGQEHIDYIDQDEPFQGGDVIVETENEVEFLLDNFRVMEIIPGEPDSESAAGAAPAPVEPISPGASPTGAREVRPCDWEGLGPGLCIYPSGGGTPSKVLEDMELEVLHSHASWSPDGQRIAFAAIEPGERPGEDTSIYIINADGSGLTELPSVCNDVHPAWSPDGEWLAFHSCGNLAIMRPDGSDPTVIWHWEDGGCVEPPQWSPDSQWIAVSMLMGGCEGAFPMTREVRVISRDGAIVTTVATITHKDEECFRPEVAFSPDGTQVAYFDADCRPWIVNADGSGQPTPLDDFPYWWTSASYPQWGGKKGAPPPKPVPSAQEEGKVVEPCEGVKPPQICVRGAESDRGTQVTDSLGFEMIGGLSWSPDGQQIVFPAGSDFEVTQQYDHKLYVINADGSDLRQVTSGDANDADPAWSPDGDWIAFHRNCGLWVVRPDGSDERMLLESSGEFCAMAMMWSRDSQRIAFLNRPDKSALREIQVINRDGTDHRVVHSFERLEWGNIAWNPDGRQIACWYGDGSKEEGLLINADGSGEPKRMDRMPWSWLPNFWPQWSEGEFVPPPPPASAPEAGPVPTDPWGQVVIPPGDAIHIGLVADFSGSVRQLGPANEGAVQMALEDQGPIKGFSVSFMTADGGCNNEMGAAAAQAMISDPLIVGVVGHTCSSSCAPGAPVYEGAHLVMISPSCTAPDLSGPGYQVFNRVAIRDDQGGDERNAHVVNTDIYQDFARRYQDRYGQSLGSTEIGFFAAYAYDATVILIKAIERVAVVDEAGNLVIGREALARAVRATPGHTGVTGVISFDDKGDRVP
jgi:serine/threonine protein kinase/Tol biopolymer transport system component